MGGEKWAERSYSVPFFQIWCVHQVLSFKLNLKLCRKKRKPASVGHQSLELDQ